MNKGIHDIFPKYSLKIIMKTYLFSKKMHVSVIYGQSSSINLPLFENIACRETFGIENVTEIRE